MLGRKGWTVTRLAQVTGLPYDTLNRCVRGGRPFAVNELELIADALTCSVHELIPPRKDGLSPTTGRKPRDSRGHLRPAA